MWEPRAGWERLPGAGPSTVGVWRATEDGKPVVVKRLRSPGPHDPLELAEPRHPAYWRRAADVALAGIVQSSPGLRGPALVSAEEDHEGITLVQGWVPQTDNPGLFLARALGRFAGADPPGVPWAARDQLERRLDQVARRGGWSTLARTPVADWADHLWRHRASYLERLGRLPQVPQHGDPVPANLLGRDGEDVVAVDWATYGSGPVGGDLGYLSLSAREEFEPLVTAYLDGLSRDGTAHDADEVRFGARAVAAYTVLTRADWALSRVASGEGALAAKFRHPSVAPYLRDLQRHLEQLEALVTGPRTPGTRRP